MVEVECPWCCAGVPLDEPALPAELRCGECATVVAVGDTGAAEQRLAA
jgi:hypothetical protein